MLQFRAFVRDTSSGTYDFRITFTKLKITVQTHENLQVNGSKESVISMNNLLYQTEPMPSSHANIAYKLTGLPKYGLLHLNNKPIQVKNDNY